MKFIADYEEGALREYLRDGENTALLVVPRSYPYISESRRVYHEKSNDGVKLLFFLDHGMLDGFSGFMYSSQDVPPQKIEFGNEVLWSEKLADHWYHVIFR